MLSALTAKEALLCLVWSEQLSQVAECVKLMEHSITQGSTGAAPGLEGSRVLLHALLKVVRCSEPTAGAYNKHVHNA
jgi:hypothetical protein